MIYGVGTDIVMVSRIHRSLHRFGDRFAKRILAPEELAAYDKAATPAQFLAKRFAAKEATAKALGTGMRRGISFRSISVYHDEFGKPGISLSGQASAFAESKQITALHLSISDEQDHALAFVVAES